MEVVKIELSKLVPNDWNPNHIKPALYKKLVRAMKRDGQVLPIVVRKHPGKKGKFEIIDGYHRLRIAGELGWKEIDCVVVEADDQKARVLTVNLNYMRGNAKPKAYAQLVHQLNETLSLEQLAELLPENELQLQDSLNLLKLPDELEKELEERAAEQAREKLTTMSLQVTEEEKAVIEDAVRSSDKKRKGSIIAELVKAGIKDYLREYET
jgi:ParB/RepB/Spo0J family partition protein